jgi:hypothetical protein
MFDVSKAEWADAKTEADDGVVRDDMRKESKSAIGQPVTSYFFDKSVTLVDIK